jgi:hypothetical protein
MLQQRSGLILEFYLDVREDIFGGVEIWAEGVFFFEQRLAPGAPKNFIQLNNKVHH